MIVKAVSRIDTLKTNRLKDINSPDEDLIVKTCWLF